MEKTLLKPSAFLNKQFLQYATIGAFNALWGTTLVFLLVTVFQMTPFLSNALTYMIGLFITYFLNRKITFKSKNKISEEFIRFIVVFVFAYCLNLLCLYFCIDVLNFHILFAQIFASGVYVISSFLTFKFFVYVQNKLPINNS